MISTHSLFFAPGRWEGEGVISFSIAADELPFKSTWTIYPATDGEIFCIQVIDVMGIAEKMENHLTFSNIKQDGFLIVLENELVGKVEGKGLIDGAIIAWEFHNTNSPFEGFEVYERKEKNLYTLKSEFSSQEEMRTFILGSLAPTQTNP